MSNLSNNIKIYLTYKQRLALFGLVFLMTVSALLEIIGIGIVPLFVAALLDFQLINDYVNKIDIKFLYFLKELSQEELLTYMTIFIIFLFVFKNIFILIVHYLQNYFNYKINCVNSEKLFQKYLFSDYSFHLNRNSSALIKNITNEINHATSFLNSIVFLIRELLIFSLTCILLLINSPSHFIYISVILFIFLITFYILIKKRVETSGKKFYQSREKLFFTIQQSLGFIKEIILLNKKNIFFNAYKKHLYSTEFQNVFLNTVNKVPRVTFELLAVFIILLIVYYFFDNSRNQLLPMLSLYAIALIRLIPSYSQISTSILKLKFFKYPFEEICKELKHAKNTQTKEGYKDDLNEIVYEKNKKIEIKNLNFSYENSGEILKDVDFSFLSGEAVGIVGSSGSGKTTLGDIIMGLYNPTNGHVLFDNKNIRQNLKTWNNIIGYVPQDVFILDATIKHNIAIEFDDELIDNNKLENAISLSNCKEFVSKLTDGLNTNVGERGVKLSGGQRQRIGIARALYKEPSIILFDEATSSLDEKNEREIINSIINLKGKKTLICISHKLSNLKQMDKLIFIENKNIQKIGKPEEIIKFLQKKTN